tara:strand:+ start:19704 stop:20708 length:1005 start_codon:yes stop_codon:yes gene_type:complete
MSRVDNFLIIGSGSMARRHSQNLRQLFPKSKIGNLPGSSSNSNIENSLVDELFQSPEEARKFKPKFVVVASSANLHLTNAAEFLQYDIPTLIEKPLCKDLEEFKKFKRLLFSKKNLLDFGYCLRYQEGALKFKEIISSRILGKEHSIMVDVGQYLPEWRPGLDYKKSVSANKSLGGGVLLELSHELDYLNWIFGIPDSVFCNILSIGNLDIDVEDNIDAILMKSRGCNINLHMDFLQKPPTRFCKVIGENGVLIWNLLENSISLENKNEKKTLFEEPDLDRNKMFLDMLSRFSILANGELNPLISLEEALNVMHLISGLEQSHLQRCAIDIKRI